MDRRDAIRILINLLLNDPDEEESSRSRRGSQDGHQHRHHHHHHHHHHHREPKGDIPEGEGFTVSPDGRITVINPDRETLIKVLELRSISPRKRWVLSRILIEDGVLNPEPTTTLTLLQIELILRDYFKVPPDEMCLELMMTEYQASFISSMSPSLHPTSHKSTPEFQQAHNRDALFTLLRGLMLRDPMMAHILFDLILSLNSSLPLNQIYIQCLTQSLKSKDLKTILQLLTVIPEELVTSKLCPFLRDLRNTMIEENMHDLLVESMLARPSPNMIQMYLDMDSERELIYLKDRDFNYHDCVMAAIKSKVHFLDQVIKVENLSRLPPKILPMAALILLQKTAASSNLKDLIFLETIFQKMINSLAAKEWKSNQSELVIESLKHLQRLYDLADWCLKRIKRSANSSRASSHQELRPFSRSAKSAEAARLKAEELAKKMDIVRTLMSNQPILLSLKKLSIFDDKFRFETRDDSHILLKSMNTEEVMIYKSYSAIRLAMMWILMGEASSIPVSENEMFNFSDEVLALLNEISPITLRTEVLENIFSLLFLTQSELDNDLESDSDNEDAPDKGSPGQRTAPDKDQAAQTSKSSTFKSMQMPTSNLTRKDSITDAVSRTSEEASSTITNTIYPQKEHQFICPNNLIAPILSTLKEATTVAQADLLRVKIKGEPKQEPQTDHFLTSVRDLDECKNRLNLLLKYINEAQWRLAVAEPAVKTPDSHPEDHTERLLLDSNEGAARFEDPTMANVTRSKGHNGNFSLIPCMLASPKQLLRYSLNKGQLERATQVARLFEPDLKDSLEWKELFLIENRQELDEKLASILAGIKQVGYGRQFEDVASKGLRQSQYKTAIHEFIVALNGIGIDSKYALMDYGLAGSPSADISSIIIEAAALKPAEFEPKIAKFLHEVMPLLNYLSRRDGDYGASSLRDILLTTDHKGSVWDVEHYNAEENMKRILIYNVSSLLKYIEMDREIIGDEDQPPLTPPAISQRKINERYEKLLTICPSGSLSYLKALFYYCRRVSHALQKCKQLPGSRAKDLDACSYFGVLRRSPSAILCSMVLKDGVSPEAADQLAKEMKVDLLSTLCSILCSSIPSTHPPHDNSVEEFSLNDSCHPALCRMVESELSSRDNASNSDSASNISTVNEMVIDYFHDETHTEEEELLNPSKIMCANHSYFKNHSAALTKLFVALKLLKKVDDETEPGTSPSSDLSEDDFPPESAMAKWISRITNVFRGLPREDERSIIALSFYPRLYPGHKLVMKYFEHYAERANYKAMYEIFRLLHMSGNKSHVQLGMPHAFKQSAALRTLKVSVVRHLMKEVEDPRFIFQIDSPRVLVDTTCKLLTRWQIFEDASLVVKVVDGIMAILKRSKDDDDDEVAPLREKIGKKVKEIQLYQEIAEISGLRTWREAKEHLTYFDILTILKAKKKYSLALEVASVHVVDQESVDLQNELLVLAYYEKKDFDSVEHLLQAQVNENSLNKILRIFNQLQSLEFKEHLLQFVVDNFLETPDLEYYKNYLIGVKLLRTLPEAERPFYRDLGPHPDLIIEQMLMNCEFGPLERAVKIYPNSDPLIELYAQKAVAIPEDFEDSSGSSTKGFESSQIASLEMTTKENWVPDREATHCMVCKIAKFSLLTRKHHCRKCGKVVCSGCSQNFIPSMPGAKKVRVCDECYTGTLIMEESQRRDSLTAASGYIELTTDPVTNDTLKSRFYYEAAPSVSLCLSIIKLHSNKKEAMDVVVDKICKPLFETIATSQQQDSAIIMSMVKSLIISTKVCLDESLHAESPDIAPMPPTKLPAMEKMLEKIELIKMLFAANCVDQELISIVFNNENFLFRLQEKLMEKERFNVVLDLATKYNLDTRAIWKTWGMMCLKLGRFAEARDKFARCLQPRSGGTSHSFRQGTLTSGQSSSAAINSQTLREILLLLSKRNKSNLDIEARCKLIKAGQFGKFAESFGPGITGMEANESQLMFSPPMSTLSSTGKFPSVSAYKEAFYYINTYGSREHLVKFYAESEQYKNALEALLNYDSTMSGFSGPSSPTPSSTSLSQTFAKDIFLAAAEQGFARKILDMMRSLDPSLQRSWRHLIFLCKFLSKNNFFHLLLMVQLFMGDYLRASMTEMQYFYLRPSPSDYRELSNRNQHLVAAEEHCRKYLAVYRLNQLNKGCLCLPTGDVERQIRLIKMQMLISAEFAERDIQLYDSAKGSPRSRSGSLTQPVSSYESNMGIMQSSVDLQPLEISGDRQGENDEDEEEQLPTEVVTLLERKRAAHTQVAALVIVNYGHSLTEGFGLARQIIGELGLKPQTVFRLAGRIIVYNGNQKSMIFVSQLLDCIKDHFKQMASVKSPGDPSYGQKELIELMDHVVKGCIKWSTNDDLTVALISLLQNDSAKIDSYIVKGRFNQAYLLAKDLKRADDVRRVQIAAREANKLKIAQICEAWLKQHQQRNS